MTGWFIRLSISTNSDTRHETGGTAFQKGLADALARVAIVRKERAYTPHVTLLYDDPLVPEQAVPPVSWRVSEFVLIDSLMNQPVKRYDVLARWPLSG